MDYLFSPRRELGKTGFAASLLGIGDLADRSVPLDQCVATVRRAMDAGLNVIDTAPAYEDGYSERIVGEALTGRRREGMFVIDKIDHHHEPVAPQVEGSLGRLKMEATDAFVFHGISKMDDWQRLAGPGGGFEQLADCVRAGKCRFRGVSSHHPDVVRAAITSGLCDVVLFAVGACCDRRYITEMLPLARKHGVGTVCFKSFGAGKLLCDTAGYGRPLETRPRGKVSSGGVDGIERTLPHLEAGECVRYTLSCDPDVALLGMSFPNEQDAAFAAAKGFTPLSAAEMTELEERAQVAICDKGPRWWDPS